MRTLLKLLPLFFLTATVFAEDKPKTTPPPTVEVVVREIKYEGQLSDVEARFSVDFDLEVTGQGEAVLPLFDGEVAVLTTSLPAGLRLGREGNQFRLFAAREGRYKFNLDLVAKINHQDPWNQVSFTGPEAAIGSVNMRADRRRIGASVAQRDNTGLGNQRRRDAGARVPRAGENRVGALAKQVRGSCPQGFDHLRHERDGAGDADRGQVQDRFEI